MNKCSFNSIEELKQNKILRIFLNFVKFQEKTFDEKAVSDYISGLGKLMNFYVEQDEKK